MKDKFLPSKNPWFFIPNLYFLEGLPYVLVNSVALIMFKKSGVPNGSLAFWTSLISWPWMLKMFWSPFVDRWGTKRQWIVALQALLLICLLGVTYSVHQNLSWLATLTFLAVMAFLSATHDVAADGFYMLSLDSKQQSFFVGIRSTAYRIAMIFGSGFLIYLAGYFERFESTQSQIWTFVFITASVFYTLSFLWGVWHMPRPSIDHSVTKDAFGYSIFKDYFNQYRILPILGFIMFYRFGESMVSKVSPLFLIDSVEQGGMGLSTENVGFINGVIGIIALTFGGIVGGITLAKWGLKRCLWPMVFSMNIPNLFYFFASIYPPNLKFICTVVAIDQFGYGFGFSAYMVYLMFIAQDSSSKTAHFAISTGLMALGALVAGSISGYLQEQIGYSGFFLATVIFSLPGVFILTRLPLDKKDLFPEKLELR